MDSTKLALSGFGTPINTVRSENPGDLRFVVKDGKHILRRRWHIFLHSNADSAPRLGAESRRPADRRLRGGNFNTIRLSELHE
ncbi:hypothetical protein [Rhizobium sp. BR 315]|uniref:hypothetical protein n=1 Tax=Rhizobium sp. BR 315 TaxID=3040014 RepID=UPI003D352B8F